MTDRPIGGALVDLDGTIYLGDGLVPGADDAVARLRDDGVSVLFLSNKAIDRRQTFRAKLNELGIPADDSAVINSAAIAARYLARAHPTDPIFVVGEPPLHEELAEWDLQVTDDPAETEVLLASMDRTIDYGKLTDALHAMDGETTFLATNPDRTCPTENGEIPDCAAVVGAIEGASGQPLDRVLGKPSQETVDAATEALGVPLERCLMIGDRLETDILMGNRAGMVTVLVMTGVTDRETLETTDTRPDFVLDSIADIDRVLDG